jgi:hypothetical protein
LSQFGAPTGNQNAKKGKAWSEAIKRAIRGKYGKEWEESLQDLAGKLVDAADKGDLQALKEIGDRLDGKPAQATELSGPDGGAIPMQTIVNFVTPSGSS